MGDFGSNRQLQALIVGKSSDTMVQFSISLLNRLDIGFVICRDIYVAAAEIAKNSNSIERILIGRLEQLKKESGGLFSVAKENNCICCCYKENVLSDDVPKDSGVFIANSPEEIEELVTKLSENNSFAYSNNGRDKKRIFNKEDFEVTKDEINALFGLESDEK